MDYYALLNVLTYLDIDSKILMRRINKQFNQPINKIKIWNYNNLINIDDKYEDLIGLRIGSFRMSKYDNLQDTLDEKFSSVCYNGSRKLVDLMIEKGANNWNSGLGCACRGGNLNIVNLMIKKGAIDWDLGLAFACCGGHLNLVNLMIEKGAKLLNRGFADACKYGHLNIVNLMIKYGATKCDNCNKSIEEHLSKKGLT
jgi:ankyrin repeat protein